jgi:hypothetical protein
MEIPLPQAIETYVRAENAGDAEAISECFAPYATVRDADDYYEGRPAIKSWKTKSRDHQLTPLAISTSDGIATLKARLSGKFPGSPVTANFHFAIVDDQIASLQIRC